LAGSDEHSPRQYGVIVGEAVFKPAPVLFFYTLFKGGKRGDRDVVSRRRRCDSAIKIKICKEKKEKQNDIMKAMKKRLAQVSVR